MDKAVEQAELQIDTKWRENGLTDRWTDGQIHRFTERHVGRIDGHLDE
jgi:hypothetical protein